MIMIETKRLCLRTLEEKDLPVLLEIRNDKECAHFQRWDDTTAEAIAALIRQHSTDQFASTAETQRYAISLPCGKCIGDVTIFYTARDNCFTLGISVHPQYQKMGYACEILQKIISVLKAEHPSAELVALIHPRNGSSQRLFKKLGFIWECYAESIDSDVYTL